MWENRLAKVGGREYGGEGRAKPRVGCGESKSIKQGEEEVGVGEGDVDTVAGADTQPKQNASN